MKYEQDERQVSGLAGLAAGQAAQAAKPAGHLESFHHRLVENFEELVNLRVRMERHLDSHLGAEPADVEDEREQLSPACMMDHINQDLQNMDRQIEQIRYQVERLERL